MSKSNIKELLIKECVRHTESRILAISRALELVSESRNDETKSSAGDKYETGRAMMQLEEDKNRSQLARVQQVMNTLHRISTLGNSDKAELGSLVETDKGSYFISIGLGKVMVDKEVYYCVSIDSPVGELLMGREAGEKIEFNGSSRRILSIF